MTAAQAKRLLLYSVLMRDGDPQQSGMVMDQGPCAINVRWSKGQSEWLPHSECRDLELWHPEPVKGRRGCAS